MSRGATTAANADQPDAGDGSRRASATDMDSEDEPPAHTRCLYDKPQDDWGVSEWRELALYLAAEVQRTTAAFASSVQSHTATVGVLGEAVAEARKNRSARECLVLIERSLSDKTLKFTVTSPKRKPGRKKKLTPKVAAALVVVAGRHGKLEAARLFAEWQLKREGHDPHSRQLVLARYTKTWSNKVSPAMRLLAADIDREHGVGLMGHDIKSRFGLLKPSKAKRTALK